MLHMPSFALAKLEKIIPESIFNSTYAEFRVSETREVNSTGIYFYYMEEWML